MFADDILSVPQEQEDKALAADAKFLLLNQTAVTRGVAENVSECVSECIARVSEIASRCAGQTKPWTDTDFDLASGKLPMPSSLVDDDVMWVKITDVYESGGELFLHTRTEEQPRHVEVGKFDSSALFSAASLLSYRQLQALVIAYDAYAGVYGLRLFINGRWQFILVDGVIGCTRTIGGVVTPVFARSGVVGELWPMLLEKAYMKVRGGCVAAPTDSVEEAWQLLSGGVSMELPRKIDDSCCILDQVCSAMDRPNTVVAFERIPESRTLTPASETRNERAQDSITDSTLELTVVDSVQGGSPSGRTLFSHSANPGRPTKSEIDEVDFDAHVQRVLKFHTTPQHWSTSLLFGALITQQSLDVCVLSVVEDLRCFISISAWKTAELPGTQRLSLSRRLRFKLTCMPATEWEQFDGNRAALLALLRQDRSDCIPPDPPASSTLCIELSSDRVYFIIPHIERTRGRAASPSSPASSNVAEESIGYTLRVDANKFRLNLQLHDTYSSCIGRAVAEFGIYRHQKKKRLSVSRASSPVHDDRGDMYVSPPSSPRSESPTSGLELLQNIRIVVLSEEVACLMSECPSVRVKHCRLIKPQGNPIGLTLFSPKGETGVHVSRIREGSAAERVHGLNISDVLLEVNGVATFRYGTQSPPDSSSRPRIWCTHEEVIQLLVRAGDNFSMLLCSQEGFRAIPPNTHTAVMSSSCVAIEERGHVKLLPRNNQAPRGRLGFATSQLSTIGRYREKAAALQELHTAGNLEEFEYRACLKIALANTYWSANAS